MVEGTTTLLVQDSTARVPALAWTDSTAAMLTVQVRSAVGNREPLELAQVWLIGPAPDTTRRLVHTRATGMATLAPLPVGSYRLSARRIGFGRGEWIVSIRAATAHTALLELGQSTTCLEPVSLVGTAGR